MFFNIVKKVYVPFTSRIVCKRGEITKKIKFFKQKMEGRNAYSIKNAVTLRHNQGVYSAMLQKGFVWQKTTQGGCSKNTAKGVCSKKCYTKGSAAQGCKRECAA